MQYKHCPSMLLLLKLIFFKIWKFTQVHHSSGNWHDIHEQNFVDNLFQRHCKKITTTVIRKKILVSETKQNPDITWIIWPSRKKLWAYNWQKKVVQQIWTAGLLSLSTKKHKHFWKCCALPLLDHASIDVSCGYRALWSIVIQCQSGFY